MIALLVVVLLVFVLGSWMFMGALGLAATPSRPSRQEAAARLAEAPDVLAGVFDGRLNTSFTRRLWEPITEDMLMDAANAAGYRLALKEQVGSLFNYHFTLDAAERRMA